MPHVTISVSENILTSLNTNAEEIAFSMRKEFALKAFRDGKLTLSQSANLCDMNLYDFISTASQAGITIIDYGIEEVERELAMLNAESKLAQLAHIKTNLEKLNETEPLPPEFDDILSRRVNFAREPSP